MGSSLGPTAGAEPGATPAIGAYLGGADCRSQARLFLGDHLPGLDQASTYPSLLSLSGSSTNGTERTNTWLQRALGRKPDAARNAHDGHIAAWPPRSTPSFDLVMQAAHLGPRGSSLASMRSTRASYNSGDILGAFAAGAFVGFCGFVLWHGRVCSAVLLHHS